VEIIRENGGKVLTEKEVVKFMVRDGKIASVQLKNGETINGDYFISNAHPAATLEWIDPSHIRRSYRRRIEGMENTPGFFSVYMVLKDRTLPYQNYNHFHYASDDYFRDVIPDTSWPQTWLLYTPAHGEQNGYATIASALTFMPFSQYSRWAGIPPKERGQDYQEFKNDRVEKLLGAVADRYSGLRGNVEAWFVSTPLTFQDYTNTKDGSAYGILKDCNNPALSIVSPRTKIENLYLTGQNLNIHGVLGTTIGAILTSSELTGFKELIKKILRA
jgi:all-trans-retinol 13,14-reductase